MDYMTLREWLNEWYNIYKKPVLSKSSLENIERVIRLHIPDWLKDILLSDLRPLMIDKALVSVSSTRQRKYAQHIYINSLKKAYRLDLIDFDLSSKIEHVHHASRIGKALTHAEQKAFLEKIVNHRMYNLFLFYLYTGVRRVEALSLRWVDVDFHVGQMIIRGTKTYASFRILTVLPAVVELLHRQRKLYPDSVFVFPFNRQTVTKTFKRYCPNHKLHDLRHTFITRCAECGMNVNAVQYLAGHSDVKTTLKIYTHVTHDFTCSEYEKFRISDEFSDS